MIYSFSISIFDLLNQCDTTNRKPAATVCICRSGHTLTVMHMWKKEWGQTNKQTNIQRKGKVSPAGLLTDINPSICYSLYVRTPRAYLSIDGAGLLHHGVETWCLAGVLASGGARGSGGPGLVSSGRLWDRCGHRTSQLCSTVCWEAHHCPKKLLIYIYCQVVIWISTIFMSTMHKKKPIIQTKSHPTLAPQCERGVV